MTTLLTTCRRSVALRVASLLILLPSLVLLPSANIQANPENGVVVAGLAEIGEGLDGHLSIHQGSDRAIINWEAFSIAEGELTQFLQPGADSAILNRVIADNPSALNGALRANGNVFLINPAGIMVGPGGAIDVNGFVASTLDVPDASFMSGGDLIFSGSSENGVTNFGRISAVGGDVFLIGKSVTNAGSIAALEGTVGLAAGSEVLITAQPNAGGERVFVRPGPGAGAGNGVVNSGSIEGAAVELKAHGNMYAMAINNSGTVRATGSSSGGGGKVWLTAPGGHISNSGSIRASLPSGAGGSIFMNAGKGGVLTAGGEINADGTGGGSLGGKVVLLGEEISVPGGTSISANGDAGGGTVIIGGGANPQTDDEDEANSGGTVESSTINIAAGSSISASGANGPGGIVVIAGSDTSTVSVGGSVSATGGGGSDGGAIFLGGGDVTVTETSVIDASGGVNGGVITIQGETSATVNGGARAVGGSGDGGVITVTGKDGVTVGDTGVLDASGGTNGGVITVASEKGTATFNGTAMATGVTGNGGQITVTGDQGVSVGNNALLDASGGANGGIIVIDGVNGVTDFNGTTRANGGTGVGGQIQISGDEVNLNSTSALDANGGSGGGQIDVGGGFQGRDASINNATNTTVGNGATLSADALISGTGGQIVVWADNDTLFDGMISARGISGGGLVEVSGKERLGFAGTVSTLSADGTAGVLLLDPRNGVISTAAHAPAGSPFIINRNTLQTALGSNNVIVSTFDTITADAGNISINDRVLWDSAFSLSLLAEGNIFAGDDVINRGAGNINLVAGWDPGVAPLGIGSASFYNVPADVDMDASIFGVAGSYGANSGSVYLGVRGDAVTGADRAVVIGSRTGQTNVAGYDVNVIAGLNSTGENRYSQIGYDREDAGTANALAPSGRIKVHAVNDVTLQTDQTEFANPDTGGAARYAYAHIGHGGHWGSARQEMSGDIEVIAGRNVTGHGGGNRQAFAMIGHGGTYGNDGANTGTLSGKVTVEATSGKVEFLAGNGYNSFAQVGHGGRDVRPTDYVGDTTINVKAGTDVIFHAGNGRATPHWNNREAYAQLGHGGWSSHALAGEIRGDIIVDAGGMVDFRAGDQRDNYVSLGLGGRSTRGDTGHTGDITVTAGSGVNFIAGTLRDKVLSLNDAANGGDPNDDGRMYAMLGHGGWDADANLSNTYVAGKGHSGDISVTTSGGDINFFAGSATRASIPSFGDGQGRFLSSQLGHGGAATQGDHKGSIHAEATAGSVNFEAGNADDNSGDRYHAAQLGHGSNIGATWGTAGVAGNLSSASVSGNTDGINVVAGDAVNFLGGKSSALGIATASNQNYAQLGLGGYGYVGNHTGDINVTAGAGGINFTGGEGNPTANNQGNQNYALLGNGGTNSRGDHGGNITVLANGAGGINFQAGTAIQGYAQLGHGGWDADNPNGQGADTPVDIGNIGNIMVTTTGGGSVTFTRGTNNDTFAQLGHGGRATSGDHDGNITVISDNAVAFGGQGGANLWGNDESYVQLGHGGHDARGDHSGNITVSAKAGGVAFTADKTHQSYALLGHGGLNADRPDGGSTTKGSSGTITVTTTDGGDVTFTAGDTVPGADGGRRSFAQLGHGGRINSGHQGNDGTDDPTVSAITVNAAGSVNFNGSMDTGDNSEAYAQLGHGGDEATGNHLGNISVTAGTGINFLGGLGTQNYALLGHGGTSARGDHAGDITVISQAGGIRFQSGPGAQTWAQLGHGGWDADAPNAHSGNISVTSNGGGDIEFDARSHDASDLNSDDSYVQLGHGGRAVNGNHFGTIEVITDGGGNINFTGGDYRAYAQLGHGGRDSIGNMGEDATRLDDQSVSKITVDSSGGIKFMAIGHESNNGWNGREAYVQLGHGGAFARGDHLGEIDVKAVDNIIFDGGNIPGGSEANYRAYAQLGHGGYDADSHNPGDNAASLAIPGGGTYLFDGYGFVGADAYGQARFGPTAAQRVGNRGDITVETVNGAIVFNASDQSENYSQLGHGGYINDGDNSGNITVRADIDRSGGGTAGTNINGQAYAAGDILFDARGEQGAGVHNVQLGHGGYFASGGHTGHIVVEAGGNIDFIAGRDNSSAQVGHGGRNDYLLNFTRYGTQNGANGHDNPGPEDRDQDSYRLTNDYNSHTQDISVTINTTVPNGFPGLFGGVPNDIRTNGNDRYFAGTHTGDITVNSTGNIRFTGFTSPTLANVGGNGWVQIGHGGWRNAADPISANGDGHNGDIAVNAGVDALGSVIAAGAGSQIIFESGMQNNSHAQIGHGGYESLGNHKGDIDVAAAAGVDFHARGGNPNADWGNYRAENSYVQIGHGGIGASYDPFLPRALESTFVGDGGDDNINLPGAIGSVFWEDAVNNQFFANVVGFDGTNFATFGAGYNPFGSDPLRLAPATGQGALMPLTTFNQTYVDPSTIRWVDHDNNTATPSIPIIPTNRGRWHHIAAPGAVSDGSGGFVLGSSGDITVTAKTGDILLEGAKADRTAGTGSRMSFNSYVQVGHGGYRTGGDHTGNIEVRAETGNVVLSAAQGTKNTDRSYAQIGLGGMESGGNMTGDVTVVAAGSVTGRAGTGNQDYVQIGNGGYDANWLFGRQTNSTGDQRAGVSAADRRGDDLFYLYNPGFARRSDVNPSYGNDVGGQPQDPSIFTRMSGDVSVVGGTGVDFEASLTGGSSYAQIGHAGRATSAHTDGKITVDTSGSDPTNGGAALGAGGDVRFQTGNNDNYAQLGHGGRDASGNHGDSGVLVAGNIDTAASKITVNSGGAVAFGSTQMTNQWGQSNRTFVQLGHGGWGARGDHVGDIEVTSVGTISFTGGTGMESYAQLGNGGFESDGPNNTAGQGNIGKIDVTTTGGGDILFIAGGTAGGNNGRRSYAQLGHGGFDVWGNHGEDPNRPGDTTVSAINVNSSGGITFQAGKSGSTSTNLVDGGGESYAILGFGGQAGRGDFVGDIAVVAVGDILFKGGLDATSTRNAVFVGHSGWDMDNPNGNTALANRGYIHVASLDGDISLESGLGTDSSVMIGHGGRSTAGANTGDIVVRAGGDVTLDANSAGAAATRSFTQIGHGGYDSDGLHSGVIKLSSGTGSLDTGIFSDIGNFGALTFTDTSVNGVRLLAGLAGEAHAQIGHGGFATTGNHNGEVVVVASKDITLTASTGNNAAAQIGHGGNGSPGNFSGAINVISTGGDLTLTGSSADHRYALIGHGTEHSNSTGTRTGDIFVSIDGTTTLSDTRASIGHRTSTAGGVTNTQFSLISGVLASSNESVTDMIANNITAGDVTIATTASDFNVTGTGASFNSANHVNLLSTMNVNVSANVQNAGAGTVNLAGGWDEATGLGAIHLANCPPITGQHFTFAPLKATPDSGPTTYGNNGGGVNIGTGAQTQDVLVGSAGGQTNALGYFVNVTGSNSTGLVNTQLGFNTSGAAADATIMVDALAGGVTVAGGSQTSADAQIGHGGAGTGNDASGAIMIDTSGNVAVNGGAGDGAAAQIGHGGTGSGGDRNGQIDVTANGNVTVMGGGGPNTGALIGNGGRNAVGDSGGDVTVTTDGSFAGNDDITVMAGGGTSSFAQIGNGGTNSGALGAITGNVTVMAPGAVAVTGGNGDGANARIGLGGDGSSGSKTGAISVTGDSVSLAGGTNATSAAQIGHGGTNGSGQIDGGVSVIADGAAGSGDIALASNAGSAQIGSGGAGYNGGVSNGNIVATTENGDVLVSAAAGGVDAIAQIGHGGVGMTGGAITGTITVDTTTNNNITDDEVILTGGANAGTAARIGHGGAGSGNEVSGNVTVTSDTNVTLASGTGDRAGTQIGHGGDSSSGVRSGTIDVTGGGTVALTGGGVDAGSQIGHGGRNALGDSGGDVTVTSTSADTANDDVTVAGGTGTGAYAQIGNGGTNSGALGAITGNVTVTAPGAVAVAGGDGVGANAQIGLGGESSSGTLGSATQTTSVSAGEDVTITAGSNALTYAQIGNGGRDSSGATKEGDTSVTAGGDVNLTGGGGVFSYAQIGLGGATANGDRSGDVTVNAGDDVNLMRGAGPSAYAKIGHGDQLFSQPSGFGGTGTSNGDITVTAVDSLGLTGGMIGHVDPALGGATAGTGNTSIAVSRFDDPAITNGTHGPDTGVGESNRDPGTGLQSPNVDDGGNLVADANSVFSSAGTGELRLYIPTRSDNQIVGASLNGTVFTGAPVDPSPQLLNEFTVVRYPPGGAPPVHEDQHDNVVGGASTGYDAGSGFSFYYDAIEGQFQGFVPPPGSTGGVGGGGGGSLLAPVGFGGAGSSLTPPQVVPVDPFLVFIDGVPFFGSNRLFDGSGRTFVGFFLFGMLEDRFDNEEPRESADGEEDDDEHTDTIKGEGGSGAYDIRYRPDNRPGVSSFDIFGGGGGTQDAGYFQP